MIQLQHDATTVEELLRDGGPWLDEARSFMRRHTLDGERLQWDSEDKVRGLTVRKLELLAAFVARAAIEEDRTKRSP